MKKSSKTTEVGLILKLLTVLNLILGLGGAVYMLFSNRLSSSRLWLISVSIIILLNLIAVVAAFKLKRLSQKWGWLLLVVNAILLAGFLVIANKSNQLLAQINFDQDEQIVVSAIASKQAQAPRVMSDVKRLYYLTNQDQTYIKQVLNQLSIESHPVADLEQLIDLVFKDQSGAILINEAYRGLLVDQQEDFPQLTRVIHSYKFRKVAADNKSSQATQPINEQASFNLYLSGIDSYGNIGTTSRSDVNIVATVNYRKGKIILTNIPRDAYVQIPYGGQNQFDKLTHAGIYGIKESMGALEKLLDISISKYIKVNFSSLLNIVDYFDGITVNNPVAFKAVTGDYFAAGQIDLNSRRALAFVRERKNLPGGDFDRGANQQRVIEALFKKITAKRNLGALYLAIEQLLPNIRTNFSKQELVKIIDSQMQHNINWEFETNNLTGRGQVGGLKSFAMPNARLYMLVIDKPILQQIRNQIKANLD